MGMQPLPIGGAVGAPPAQYAPPPGGMGVPVLAMNGTPVQAGAIVPSSAPSDPYSTMLQNAPPSQPMYGAPPPPTYSGGAPPSVVQPGPTGMTQSQPGLS